MCYLFKKIITTKDYHRTFSYRCRRGSKFAITNNQGSHTRNRAENVMSKEICMANFKKEHQIFLPLPKDIAPQCVAKGQAQDNG